MPGTLYVTATPIGNLGDLSPRAAALLARVELVVAEDTRHSRRLLQELGARPRMLALPAARELERVPQVLAALGRGDVALISDAGTPAISDPGRRLVAGARAAGFRVLALPGPSALAAAVSASGLRCDRFLFLGFLPRTRGRAQRLLGAGAEWALVFHESPHRLATTLVWVEEVLGPRRVAVAREISKLHEEWLLGEAAELGAMLAQTVVRGECTVVVEAPARGTGNG